MVDNGSADNCEVTLSLDKDTFNCDETGVQTVVLTATDASGNTTSSTASVTVADVTVPTVITKNITVALDANGNANITPQQVDNGSFDNCNIVLSVDKTAFDCNTTGEQTVTLTGTDPSGNTASATAIVTVVDNTPPVITAQNITATLDVEGNAVISAVQFDNGSTDNCGISTFEVSKVSFDCSNLGDNIVTLTVTDNNGNVSTTTATVTIIDNITPTVITKNISVELDANGSATITASQVDNGSFDNCDITLSIDKTTFDCADAGPQTVTLTGTDASGNTASATATVTVINDNAPEIITNDITVNLDQNGNASISAADLIDNAVEVCTVVPYAGYSNHAVGLQNYYPNNNTFIDFNFDSNGGQLTQYPDGTATVRGTIVNGSDANDIWVVELNIDQKRNWTEWSALGRSWKGNANTVGNKYKDWSYYQMSTTTPSTLTGAGNNAGQVKTITHMPANYNYGFQVGQAANDKNGNYGMSGWFFYTNGQGESVQGDFNMDITSCTVTTGTSPCDPASIEVNQSDFDCSDLGQNTVTLTVTDRNGNTTTRTSVVTVADNIAPTVLTKNITVALDANGNANITASQVDNGSSDNCDITLSIDKTSFDCNDIGQQVVTLTGTDASGNTASATATVTIIDNIAPTVITKNISVELDANGSATITASQVDNGSFDNCNITLSINKTTFDCADAGAQTVILTGTDASGNTASATATVTIVDNAAPQIVTNNITLALGDNGTASVSAADLIDNAITMSEVTAFQGGNNHSVWLNKYTSSNQAVLFKFDSNGGHLTQYPDGTATVTGTIVNPNNANDKWVVQLNLDQKRNWTEWSALGRSWKGNANTVGTKYKDWSYYQMSTAQATTLTGQGSNAGKVKTLTHMPANYNYGFQVGQAANDKNGNYGMSGWFFYTNDQNQAVQGDFNLDITSTTITTGTGPCDPESIQISQTNFDCSDIGQNTVTITVTDRHGNTNTQTATVNVVDNIAPTVLTKNITVALDANGNANIMANQVDNGSSDNCDITLSIDKTSFDCNDIGQRVVTLTGTDTSGNTASATATVTVIDNTAPVINVNNSITVEVDENGNATITQSQVVTSVGDDNCGNITITISKTSFDCADLGTNTITVTATDVSGNVTTETVTVTVVDSSAPVFTNPTSGSVISQNPTAPAMDFNVFVRNNVSFKNNETEGAVALGGDLSIDGSYQVSTNSKGSFKVGNVPVTLVVGGKVNYNSGNSLQVNQNGYVKIGNANGAKVWYQDQNGANSPIRVTKDNNYNSSPRLHLQANAQQLGVSASNNPIFQSNVIDFDAAFAQFEASALSMSQLANNANLTNPNGQPIGNTNLPNQVKINLQDGLNVLNVTGADLNKVSVFTFNNQPSQSKILIVNVNNPGTFNWNVYNTGGIGEHVSPYILYNFYNSSTVKIQGNGSIIGTVFAPFAFINKTSHNNISGQVIGKSFTQLSGENHMFGFSGTINSGTTTQIEDGSTVVRNVEDCTYSIDGNEFTPAVSDNSCGDLSLTYTLSGATTGSGTDLSGVNLNIGQTLITWTANDGSNTTTFNLTVDVQDNLAPTVLAKNITVALDANGNANITASQLNNGSTDNCDITLSIDKTSFDCNDIGQQVVTLTGTDASGNTASATATVTIIDNIAPTVITKNISVELDANGSATITASQVDNGSFDNCNITLSINKTTFDCADAGAQTVTLTGTDASGNTASATATVTIVDNAAPQIVTNNITLALGDNGTASVSAADLIDNAITMSDVTAFQGGNNHSVWLNKYTSSNQAVLFKFDNNGGHLTQYPDGTATVTGTIVNPNNANDKWVVQLNLDQKRNWTEWSALGRSWKGNANTVGTKYKDWSYYQMSTAQATTLTGQGSNAGKVKTLTHMPANYNYGFQVGQAANDKNGNYGMSGWFFYTNDQNQAVQGDFNLDITSTTITTGTGPCDPESIQISQTNFDCSDIGQNTVTITVTDRHGNTNTQTATVNVVDDTTPVFTSNPGNKVYQAENGNCSLNAYWAVPVVSDNCIVSVTSTHNPGDAFSIGTTKVTYTATDAAGNTASIDFNVTVQASPMNVVVQASSYTTASGIYNVSCSGAGDGNVMLSVTGGCGPYSYQWSNGATTKNISGVDAGTYSVTITDNNGTQIVKSVTLTAPAPIVVEGSVTTERTLSGYGDENTVYLGFGEQTAVLQANASGGSGDYTYNWSPSEEIACSFENTVTVAPQVTTTYTVVVTDSNGCSTTEDFTIYVVDVRCNDYSGPSDNTGGDGNNNGGSFDCQCEGKMKNFTVVYNGFSGVTITSAFKKDKKTVIKTFNNVQNGDVIQVSGFDHKGRLDSKTYLKIGNAEYEIHTSCSINILDETYGPFTVTQYTDGEGSTCSNTSSTMNSSSVTFTGGFNEIVSKKGGSSFGKGKDKDKDKDKDEDDDDEEEEEEEENDDNDSFDCQCEGRMENFTVIYKGTSGKTVKAYNKKMDYLIATFDNVQYGDELVINGFDKHDRLESKTMLKVDWTAYEIHTSCSVNILGDEIGPFEVIAYTDGEGYSCSLTTNGGGNGDGGNNNGCDVETIQWSGNISICYNGQTYCVSQNEVANYLAMGASLGSCGTGIIGTIDQSGSRPIGSDFEAQASVIFEVNTYPNPTSDLANITFNVNREGPVTVAVYDTKGLQVGTTLFEENAEMDRNYTVVFDGSSVKEGIYIIRLRTAGYVESKKLMIKR